MDRWNVRSLGLAFKGALQAWTPKGASGLPLESLPHVERYQVGKEFKARWESKEELVLRIGTILSTGERINPPADDPISYSAIGKPLQARVIELLSSESILHGSAFDHHLERIGDPTGGKFSLDLRGIPFTSASLKGAYLVNTCLDYSDFQGATLEGSDLQWASIQFANFGRANLVGITAIDTNFRGTSFSSANLDDFGATYAPGGYDGCFGFGTNGPGAMMAPAPPSRKFKLSGPYYEIPEEYRSSSLAYVDFSGIKASESMLSLHAFWGASFSWANFDRTYLDACKFMGCSFYEASFRACPIRYSVFFRCQFDRVTFRKCDLKGTKFVDCEFMAAAFPQSDLVEVVFENCTFDRVDFRKCNLLSARGSRLSVGPLVNPDASDTAGSRRLVSSIKGEQWIAEYKSDITASRNPLRRLAQFIWWFTCDYGRSFARLSIVATGIVLTFAGVFSFVNSYDVGWSERGLPRIERTSTPAVALVGQSSGLGGFQSLHLSIDIFSNLGISRIEALKLIGAILIWTEAALGWLVLGCLLTVLGRRLIPPT